MFTFAFISHDHCKWSIQDHYHLRYFFQGIKNVVETLWHIYLGFIVIVFYLIFERTGNTANRNFMGLRNRKCPMIIIRIKHFILASTIKSLSFLSIFDNFVYDCGRKGHMSLNYNYRILIGVQESFNVRYLLC